MLAYIADMTIADRIRQAREEKNLSKAELSRRLDLGRQAVQAWESGTAKPDSENLLKLASVLEVRPEWLVRGGAAFKMIAKTETAFDEDRMLDVIEAVEQWLEDELLEMDKPDKAKLVVAVYDHFSHHPDEEIKPATISPIKSLILRIIGK